MEEAQKDMQSAVLDVLNNVDKKCLRPLHIQMYQCAISCCQDETYNMESMERCVENCSKELQFAHNFLENELNKWQQRTERCLQDCRDTVTDQMFVFSDRDNERQMNKYTKEAEACASKCFVKQIQVLPRLADRVINALSGK